MVKGSLNWKDHLPLSVHGLWYYMDTAVTRHKNQMISGEVSFVKDVRVDNFITKSKEINGIDLDYILVYDPVKKSLPDQVYLKLGGNAIRLFCFYSIKFFSGLKWSKDIYKTAQLKLNAC